MPVFCLHGVLNLSKNCISQQTKYKELGIHEGTMHTWLKAVRAGKLDIGEGSHTPASAMSLSEEITMLRKRVKEQDKEIRRLKEENEFLEEASAFFAASRRKSAKTRE